MKKIKSLFKRDYATGLIYNEYVEGTEWVVNGEGIAHRKYDGTCCCIIKGELYKRYDAKKGKIPPEGFIPAQEPDIVTGHWPGWLKCNISDPSDKWHFEAFNQKYEDGTYELCGPKIRANAENFDKHILISHKQTEIYYDCPTSFEELKEWFKGKNIEGVVWHRSNGDMIKIKKKDFGLKRTD